jgi:mRNA interferase RelE/StbE
MSYSVNLKRSAEKELRDLTKPDRERVVAAILNLREDPLPPGIKKLKNMDGYRLRVGDYRILYTVNEKEKLLEVYAIGHRKDVYRK